MARRSAKREKRLRKASEGSSSNDEEKSPKEFDDNRHEEIVDDRKKLLRKKEILKSSLIRFSQSLIDLSLSPTSVHFIGSSSLSISETPYEKLSNLILAEAKHFH